MPEGSGTISALLADSIQPQIVERPSEKGVSRSCTKTAPLTDAPSLLSEYALSGTYARREREASRGNERGQDLRRSARGRPPARPGHRPQGQRGGLGRFAHDRGVGPPPGMMIPPHTHAREDECSFVLEGELT